MKQPSPAAAAGHALLRTAIGHDCQGAGGSMQAAQHEQERKSLFSLS